MRAKNTLANDFDLAYEDIAGFSSAVSEAADIVQADAETYATVAAQLELITEDESALFLNKVYYSLGNYMHGVAEEYQGLITIQDDYNAVVLPYNTGTYIYTVTNSLGDLQWERDSFCGWAQLYYSWIT